MINKPVLDKGMLKLPVWVTLSKLEDKESTCKCTVNNANKLTSSNLVNTLGDNLHSQEIILALKAKTTDFGK